MSGKWTKVKPDSEDSDDEQDGNEDFNIVPTIECRPTGMKLLKSILL